ncbi:MAG: AAA family ATPase [Planctomycetes bacterium]|nr:AAA family ATPase [Planctomycetota bacterium]
MAHEALKSDVLSRRCDPASLPFDTTDDVEPLADIVGQSRAVEAVRFGIDIEQHGYNIFALGPPGVGKLSLVRQFLETRAAAEPTPSDWCYVNNFEEPHKPRALSLPPGWAHRLCKDMEVLVDDATGAMNAAFESDTYQQRQQNLQQQFADQQKSSFDRIQEEAKEKGLAVIQAPQGIGILPLDENAKPMSPKRVEKLSDQERSELEQRAEELQRHMQGILQEAPRMQRQIRQKLKDLNQEIAAESIAPLIDDLKRTYKDIDGVEAYLEAVRRDMIENAEQILKIQQAVQEPGDAQAAPPIPIQPPVPPAMEAAALLRRYRVNVLVGRDGNHGAPLVYEDHPNYPNLLGRVEHMVQMGALVADFNLIKPGALHQANGGYLVLDAHKLLMAPQLWEGLKRALRAEEIRIESLYESIGLIQTVSLEPEPIPLRVKVVVMGRPILYHLLREYDEEFAELFKVAADFDTEMDWDDQQDLYAHLIATLVHKDGLRPFDRTAVARVIERSGRLAEDSRKLSVHMRSVADLLHEASHWAAEAGSPVVRAEHVQHAIDAQVYRFDRIAQRLREEIHRGTLLVDTDGAAVGQINGLAVMKIGDLMFGRPSRITARVRVGSGKVIDIEREVELGESTHSKGVLILSGFLAGRYARDLPLALSASLVFEQSYGPIGGDSASLAELLALLSAIASVPLRQDVAVTGSVNQHGQVQAIGGVNEKIEGFFDVCAARGLTGRQGVAIPASNAQHLMLRQDVVDAVDAGRFAVYTVGTVDDAIDLLAAMPAGVPDAEGRYGGDTFNGKVAASLEAFALRRKTFAPKAAGGGEEGGQEA